MKLHEIHDAPQGDRTPLVWILLQKLLAKKEPVWLSVLTPGGDGPGGWISSINFDEDTDDYEIIWSNPQRGTKAMYFTPGSHLDTFDLVKNTHGDWVLRGEWEKTHRAKRIKEAEHDDEPLVCTLVMQQLQKMKKVYMQRLSERDRTELYQVDSIGYAPVDNIMYVHITSWHSHRSTGKPVARAETATIHGDVANIDERWTLTKVGDYFVLHAASQPIADRLNSDALNEPR